ncbi:MAG: hypothetical protein AMXMBFR57_30790 [Acidimicrobiia bacterium]
MARGGVCGEADFRDQILTVERFRRVARDAEPTHQTGMVNLRISRQHEDRDDVSLLAQACNQFRSIAVGETPVEDHHVEMFCGESRPGSSLVGGAFHAHTVSR